MIIADNKIKIELLEQSLRQRCWKFNFGGPKVAINSYKILDVCINTSRITIDLREISTNFIDTCYRYASDSSINFPKLYVALESAINIYLQFCKITI